MAAVRWGLSSAGRWLVDGVSQLTPRISRWSDFSLSILSYFSASAVSQSLVRWPEGLRPSFDIVDDVLWSIVTVFESIALVSMLCCFFLFCGCTL